MRVGPVVAGGVPHTTHDLVIIIVPKAERRFRRLGMVIVLDDRAPTQTLSESHTVHRRYRCRDRPRQLRSFRLSGRVGAAHRALGSRPIQPPFQVSKIIPSICLPSRLT